MKSNCFWTEFDRQSELSIVLCASVCVCARYMVQICQTPSKLLQVQSVHSLLFNLMKIPTPEGSHQQQQAVENEVMLVNAINIFDVCVCASALFY